MTLATLREIIRLKARPETTLSLEAAMLQHEQTVARYRFTPSIRDYFKEILSLAASDRGQGYWVQAEYGAGKTHFLATLAVLLSDHKGVAWGHVKDDDIKGFASAFHKVRFFPIILNCKGRLATEGAHASLQRVVEQAIADSLTKMGLHKKVTVGTADEIHAWWQHASQGVKSDLTHYIQSNYQGRPTPDDLLSKRGPEAFANAIIEASKALRIAIPFTQDIRSRFLHIYRQLTREQGFHGLLVIIDEFKSWQDLHPPGSQGFAEDEHVLETLAFHLPVDDHARIVTVVASQAPSPAKLMGGSQGDRFKLTSLFAGEHSAWEYDAIVADVVREVRPDHLPEVNAYYDHYYRAYSFLKQTKREYFQHIFPFQPRCFEVIRNITKRQLATTRSSIHYVYEVLDNPQNLSRQDLIKVADFLDSPNLINDLQTAVYHDAYHAYQGALGALTDLFDEAQDLQIARDIFKTLFLWHCAFKETPRGMTASDLAEACLADHEFFKKEDYVEFILGRLRDHQVIDYPSKDRGAFFRVSTIEGPNPVQILARIQRQVKDAEAQQHWKTLLTTSIQQAGGLKMLFQGVEIDRPQRVTARTNNIRYDGERAIVSGWSMVWGNPVVDKTNYALHFRIVCLLDQTEVDSHTLHDDRLAVVIPGMWGETARDSSRRYTALVKMQDEYQGKQGPEAEEMKRFIDSELQKARGEIVLAQKQLYRAGQIVTRAGLGIDPNQAFADPEKADEMIAAALLANAYTTCPFEAKAFRKEFSTAEAGKVFNALFGGSTQSGDISAVDNFGLGLGLTSIKKPKEFDPALCPFFATIREELSLAGGELRLYSFYEKYTSTPYGLLEDMVTLYLLAFVRFAQPHCYLTVKPEVGLKLKNGKAPLDNCIGPADVVQVAWARSRLHRTLDRLVQAVGPSWNDLVEFARVFDDSMKATTEREEVESQQDRLRKAQQQWHEKIERIQPRLRRLAQAMQGKVEPYMALLKQVDQVCCTTSLEEFEHALKEQFECDKEQCSMAVEQVKALDELDRRYAQSFLDALAYLEALEGIPEESSLTTERDLIQARFGFETFCKQPSQAGAVLKAFEQFTRSYCTHYQIHYREYRQQLAALETRLKKLKRKVDGLGRMNHIEELGGAVGTELLIRYQDLLARCSSQELPEELPEVKDYPTFRGITLSTVAPEKEVADFEERLEDALQTRLWQLADETIAAILKECSNTPLHALLEAIQAADVTRLAEHFTAEVAGLVRQVLRDARLVTVDVRLADYDGPAQLGDDPKELEDVITAFRGFLARKLNEARQANSGKIVRLNLKSG